MKNARHMNAAGFVAVLLTALVHSGCSSSQTGATAGFNLQASGYLIAVGGGGTPDDVMAAGLEMAGGPDASVVILPWCSATEDAGESSVPMWLQAGASSVIIIPLTEIDRAMDAIAGADLIWMPGGAQGRFMEAIEGTGIAQAIRDRYVAGAVVGGTSAGAAVQSRRMITGDADLQKILAERTAVDVGLELWPDVILDQHFLARQRMSRLISAVLDRPDMVGIGIDERTAVVRHGNTITVYGEGNALIFDARGAEQLPSEPQQNMAATGMKLHVLRKGMTFDLSP